MGHVSAPEPTTEVGVVQSQRMCVSAGSLLSSEAGSGAKGRVAAPDPYYMARVSGASTHMAAQEPSLSREVGSSTAVARGSVWMHTLPFVLA
jgi:hypothetical protein